MDPPGSIPVLASMPEQGEAEAGIGTGLERVDAAPNRTDFIHCLVIADSAVMLKPSGGENRGEKKLGMKRGVLGALGRFFFFFTRIRQESIPNRAKIHV